MTASVGSPRLIGRHQELSALDHLLRGAGQGTGGALVIVGPAGAGKSRLAEAAVTQASGLGMAVHAGRSLQLELERSLGVVLDAMNLRVADIVPSEEPGASRSLLGAAAPAAAGFLMAERLLERVEVQAQHRPVLVVLEDLHWADRASLRWLRLVVERSRRLPLVVLATTRPVSVGSHAHRELLGIDLHRMALEPLCAQEVAALASTVVGGSPGPGILTALAAAEGNAMLVLATLEAASAGGFLLRAGGLVDFAEEPAVLHPGASFAARLSELDAGELRCAQAAAVLGARFDVADLAAVLGQRVVDLLPALDAAVSVGVVVADGDRYAFRHELYREAVLDTLALGAQAALHLDAARALVAAGAAAIDVAEHFARGARPGNREAVTWLQRAAVDVVGHAPASAMRLLDLALALGGTQPPVDLLLVRVRALAAVGLTAEAEALARRLLRGALDPTSEAALQRELALTFFVQGRAGECVDAMTRVAVLSTDAAGAGRVHAEVALARFAALDHPGAGVAAKEAIERGRRSRDLVAEVGGTTVLCWLDLFVNRFDRALGRADEITSLADHPEAADAHLYQPWITAAVVRIEGDRLEGAGAAIQRGREVAERTGAAWALPAYDGLAAFAAIRAGHFDDAVAAARAALEYGDACDGFGVSVWCHGFLAQIALHAGDEAAALAAVEAGERQLVGGRAQFGWEQVASARAVLHERRGEQVEALMALAEVWDLFEAIQVLSGRQQIGCDLVRLAVLTGDLDRARAVHAGLAVAATTSGLASFEADAERAAAWVDRDADRMVAAVELARRSPRPVVLADALRDAAMLLRGSGRKAPASVCGLEAKALYEEMGAPADAMSIATLIGLAAPASARPRFGLGALTASERRVIDLLAEGLSNVDIARQLYVSRRTVESHVSAAYRKLEASSRVELARAVLTT